MKKSSLIIFFLFIFSDFVSSQQNVDIDEGFEGTWLPGGWQASSFSETSTLNHTPGGNKSAVHGISAGTNASITSEKFQVINGEQFDTISFWLRSSAITLNGTIAVIVSGSTIYDTIASSNLAVLPANTWVRYSYPYSPAANDSVSITVAISHSISIGNMYIDDVRINKSLTLPVEMAYFYHTVSANNIKLYWGTVNEINNAGFEIQRAFNSSAGSWASIGFVQGSGTTNTPVNYSYSDQNLNSGKYYYRLKQKDYNGNFELFTLPDYASVTAPSDFSLEQNYPNPSNPGSKISYKISEDANVTLKLYDAAGKEINTLVNNFHSAGYHSFEFDGSALSSGIYFYRLTAGNYSDVKKMIIVK